MSIYIVYLLILFVMIFFLRAIGISQKDSVISEQYVTRKSWRVSTNQLFLFLSFALLFTLIGFRGDNVGADTTTYKQAFPSYAVLSWKEVIKNSPFETGYSVLMKIAASISSDPAWIIMVTAAIFMVFSFIFIRENCNDYFLAVIVFISIGPYLTAFNTIRQSLALAICLVGWTLVHKREFAKAALLFVLAILFHNSAVFFPVLLIALRFLPHNRKGYFMTLLACVLFVAILRPAMNVLLRFFPIYSLRYGRGRWSISGANGITIIWVLIAAICIYQWLTTNWKAEKGRKFEVIFFSTLYITFNLAGLQFDGLQRMTMYFSSFLILLFEDSLKVFEGRSRKMYYFMLILVFSVVFIRASDTSQYVNYRFFWEG